MRTEQEVARLARNMSEALTGGVQAYAGKSELREIILMFLLLRWVLGDNNSMCGLAEDLEEADRRSNEPKGVM